MESAGQQPSGNIFRLDRPIVEYSALDRSAGAHPFRRQSHGWMVSMHAGNNCGWQINVSEI